MCDSVVVYDGGATIDTAIPKPANTANVNNSSTSIQLCIGEVVADCEIAMSTTTTIMCTTTAAHIYDAHTVDVHTITIVAHSVASAAATTTCYDHIK